MMALTAITDIDEPPTGLGPDYMNRKTGRLVYWGGTGGDQVGPRKLDAR